MATSSSSCVSVLRLGGPNSDVADLLKTALLTYLDQQQQQQAGDSASLTSSVSLVTLHNKYFSATIRIMELFQEVDVPGSGSGSDSDPTTGNTNHDHANEPNEFSASLSHQEDGIILVFDALQANPDLETGTPFDVLNVLHDNSTASTDVGDLLRLCVAVSMGPKSPEELRGQNTHEQEYSKRILWCLDRGYEYVEVDLSAEGQRTGHDERDKEGFARIIEAIQGTVWSSAVMKKQSDVASQQEEQGDNPRESTLQDHDAQTPSQMVDNQPTVEYEPPTSDLLVGGIGEPPAEHLLSDDNYYLDEPATKEEAELRASHINDAQAFQELELLMKEATRIRDMSRNGDLSDDDRRKRAADAATLMMGLMEQMGIDDTDGDDSDEHP